MRIRFIREKVIINGTARSLNDAIFRITRSVKDMEEKTRKVGSALNYACGFMEADQLKKACDELNQFSGALSRASVDLYDLQKAIYDYACGVDLFNGRPLSCSPPANLTFPPLRLTAGTANDNFVISEVKAASRSIDLFIQDIETALKQLRTYAISVGSYWLDPQYQQFKSYMDELSGDLTKHLSKLREYANYLKKRIFEYENS